MPEITPKALTDVALATAPTGAILKSAGAGRVPVLATASADYSVPSAAETFSGIKTHADLIRHDMAACPTALLKQIVPAVTSPADDVLWCEGFLDAQNFAVANHNHVHFAGFNVGPNSARLDPTKPLVRDATEYRWLNNTFYQSERHVMEVQWPDGSTLRPLGLAARWDDQTASVAFQVSSISVIDETFPGTVLSSFVWDRTAVTLSQTYTINGAALWSVSGSPSSDSVQTGRATVPLSVLYQGTGVELQLTNGVNTARFSHPASDPSLYLVVGGSIIHYWTPGPAVGSRYQILPAWVSIAKEAYPGAALDVGGSGLFAGGITSTGPSSGVQINSRADSSLGFIMYCGSNELNWFNGANRMTLSPAGDLTVTGSLSVGGGTPIAKVLSATATLDFGATAAGTSADLTVSLTGAAVGDAVSLGLPASPDANASFGAWVSAADTVTVRFANFSGGSINPGSGTYRVTVFKF